MSVSYLLCVLTVSLIITTLLSFFFFCYRVSTSFNPLSLLVFFFFFLNDPAPTEISPFPLHAALPIKGQPLWLKFPPIPRARRCHRRDRDRVVQRARRDGERVRAHVNRAAVGSDGLCRGVGGERRTRRSEEHTSELQSLAYLVCRLLLE